MGVCRICQGGGPNFLGGLGELHAVKRLAMRGVAKHLLGGFRGMLLRDNIFKWCNLIRFGAYFHKFFTLKKSKNIYFVYKNNDKLYSHVLARGFRSMIH